MDDYKRQREIWAAISIQRYHSLFSLNSAIEFRHVPTYFEHDSRLFLKLVITVNDLLVFVL